MISFKDYLAELHAPKGGLRVKAKFYKGGQFTPHTHANAWAMLKKADASLPPKAAEAIDSFIGIAHDAMDNPNTWGGMMIGRYLERAYGKEFQDRYNDAEEKANAKLVRQQIDTAFAPVREQLKKEIGPFVTLYRAQSPVFDAAGFDPGGRKVLSWTSDPDVAKTFAGWRKTNRVPSVEEIDAAVNEFNKTGIAQIKFKGWWIELNKENPEYFNIYSCKEKDGMNDENFVTDGDVKDLRDDLMRYRDERIEDKEKQDRKLSKVTMARIPLDDVVWISNRAGQKEFIVKNIPGKPWYIDTTGKRLQSFRSFMAGRT